MITHSHKKYNHYQYWEEQNCSSPTLRNLDFSSILDTFSVHLRFNVHEPAAMSCPFSVCPERLYYHWLVPFLSVYLFPCLGLGVSVPSMSFCKVWEAQLFKMSKNFWQVGHFDHKASRDVPTWNTHHNSSSIDFAAAVQDLR